MQACIVTADIWKCCVRDACIANAYAVTTWIRCARVGSTYTREICARNALVGDVSQEYWQNQE